LLSQGLPQLVVASLAEQQLHQQLVDSEQLLHQQLEEASLAVSSRHPCLPTNHDISDARLILRQEPRMRSQPLLFLIRPLQVAEVAPLGRRRSSSSQQPEVGSLEEEVLQPVHLAHQKPQDSVSSQLPEDSVSSQLPEVSVSSQQLPEVSVSSQQLPEVSVSQLVVQQMDPMCRLGGPRLKKESLVNRICFTSPSSSWTRLSICR